MKKISFKSFIGFVIFAIMLSYSLLFATGCSKSSADKKDAVVLRVCSWEDYIWKNEDEEDIEYSDMCDKFEHYMAEKGVNVKVEYSTFGTNENLYNDLKIANGYLYDVVCPSDYMIEKMAHEGMLEKLSNIDPTFITDSTYSKNVSPYIEKIFKEDIHWLEDGQPATLAEYAACYMWGTMGYVYNPDVEGIAEDMRDWTSIWDSKYRKRVTIKDSVRDSYFIGIAYVYKDELEQLKNDVDSGKISKKEYKDNLTRIFNSTDEDTVAKVEQCISALKGNLFGFEVDSGKNDMVTGKIDVYFAWSGDAVYAMDEAEDDENNPIELYYSVPEQGSNVWFDGWCVPEKAQQKELALDFINFLAMPENAIMNMEYIGYTTGIAGENDEIYDWLIDDEEGSGYGLKEEETEGYYEADLSYFFHNDAVLYTEVKDRQFTAQFPTEDIIDRCVFMNYFDVETNERINYMWENIKGITLELWAIILIIALIVLAIIGYVLYKFRAKIFVRKGPDKPRESKNKDLKVIDKKELL